MTLFDQVLVTERNALELNDASEEVSAHSLIYCNNVCKAVLNKDKFYLYVEQKKTQFKSTKG